MLWPIAIFIFIILYFVLPTVRSPAPVNLTYSQWLQDVSSHEVKSLSVNSSGNASGTLENG
jgi:cell division protease FtsH